MYIHRGSVDIWRENILEYLEIGVLDFKTIEQFLEEIKEEFGGKYKKSRKVVQLKQLEQGQQTMDKYIQLFKQAARGSGYGERPLVEEFKRGVNSIIVRECGQTLDQGQGQDLR